MSLKYRFAPDSPDFWRKFVDPIHWKEALRLFPKAPWRYYIVPAGQNAPEKWEYFQRAARWVWKKAAKNKPLSRETLTPQDIAEINAVAMLGNAARWNDVLRNNRPIFNVRSSEEIRRVYASGSCFYKNSDGFTISIDGFWPEEERSIDFFVRCRNLAGAEPSRWQKTFKDFKSMLYPKISKKARRWQVYFITPRKTLVRQLQTILNWYNKKASELLRMKSGPKKEQKVLELAVKMQRYMDISQFCMDGSGRTSKLIQDYIFLRFGYYPPDPVLYCAYGRAWENGTYLPLNKAIHMACLGWKSARVRHGSR